MYLNLYEIHDLPSLISFALSVEPSVLIDRAQAFMYEYIFQRDHVLFINFLIFPSPINLPT